MKATVGFIFFLLFLAGIAFVSLRGREPAEPVTSAEQLQDAAWRPTNIGDRRLDEGTGAFLQFNSDREMAGHGGCNRFFGQYELKDGQLVFGLIGATKMSCPQPDNEIEDAFLAALAETRSALRAGSVLAFKNAEDDTLLRFTSVDRQEK